ncbi:hypothetical protein C3Y98_00955 [Methylotenera oryzisoli]|uniref:DUF4145 domain-containing protein n=1 Tax=Methylotenera oryzisoli TaxID=2080758 RepID=A0A4Y9VTZ0_9PROT|nr:DUF4145 domain-containing protein [Methylotenera oryzisoli]TFW72960.1 hypothetical protein C3Y98_00955 [Methylotenera oryzisoli]
MTRFYKEGSYNWHRLQEIPNVAYVCGYCTTTVSSNRGYVLAHGGDGSGQHIGHLRICPNCGGPSFFAPDSTRYPSPALGNPVQHVPVELDSLYNEARRCTAATCYTAAVLVCRKMLMNIAVSQGAAEGLKFIEYVTYLSDKGYVPPNGKHWVDHIRKKGNEATHEIALMTEADAKELLQFLEMLLRFIFEFPMLVPKP